MWAMGSRHVLRDGRETHTTRSPAMSLTRPLISSRVAAPLACLTLAAVLTAPMTSAEASTSAPATDPPWTTVVQGLDNPRLLSFTGGALYVAEAGTGGAGPCVTGAEGEACYGTTGAVTRVRGRHQDRVLSGLPSLAGADGGSATGPADVLVTGHRLYAVTIGLGNNPTVRAQLPPLGRRLMGTVATGFMPRLGPWPLGDLAAAEAANDPDGAGPDSNPTGMVATYAPGHHRRGKFGPALVVTDSGANALLRVGLGGQVSTVAVFDSPGTAPAPFPPFPPLEMQSVPTSVATGPDGAWYVSELTGFPFAPGTARIHRVTSGGQSTVWATGLTNVTDLAWHHGDLYAVQLSSVGLASETGLPMGSLVRVVPGADPEVVAGPLPAPYGVAFRGKDAYVTTCAVCADTGSVVRVPVG